uniref:Copper(I)-binding protein n=1 Tax=Candidatus Kentrum sp. MB TaxID=2138164 RepID=A0A450X8R1_9GAMM|nr:MAG: hypothetical protein BECKMB1821G_GA0114241_101541 [Candidatus Kentron sp. MB]VFK29707.1 MAG: hypothetical protein BECKMB1821I_GA0114274_101140 [Candidatus Kentron sp. MB]VFK74877.1 MAG: hypothetical protein BECKMB1821H_GA0114242_101140 [Candidatus Kentron sp. MB]
MRTTLVSLFILIGTVFWGAAAAAGVETEITVVSPWIREAPPGARALAGYMALHNHGNTNVSLVSASSPDFQEVMLHETITRKKMATMVHLERIEIPAKGQASLKPGGMHMMLMQPKRAFTVGDEATITLVFANGAKISAIFKVKKPSDNAPKTGSAHAEHHH